MLLTQSRVFLVHDEKRGKKKKTNNQKTEKHASLQARAGLKFKGREATGARAGWVMDVMGCQGSRTWHIEDGIALVHGKHVGARADVHACILRLDVLNCQDAVEVHGPVGQLPVTHSSPDESVSW